MACVGEDLEMVSRLKCIFKYLIKNAYVIFEQYLLYIIMRNNAL